MKIKISSNRFSNEETYTCICQFCFQLQPAFFEHYHSWLEAEIELELLLVSLASLQGQIAVYPLPRHHL